MQPQLAVTLRIEVQMHPDPHEERRLYSLALGRVLHRGQADPATLAAITPHIGSLDTVNTRLGYHQILALPGTSVRGAFWQLSRDDNGMLHLRACRTNWSFGHPDPLHLRDDIPGVVAMTQFMDEALGYGGRNWGPYLLTDEYPSAAVIELRDPTRPDEGEQAPGGLLVATAYAFLLSDGRSILTHAEGRPRRAAFEAALKFTSNDSVHGLEMVGWHPERFYFCARCGNALAPSFCTGCKRAFPQDPARDTVTDFPVFNVPMARVIYEKFIELGLKLPFEVLPI